jgi:hypothetical protein
VVREYQDRELHRFTVDFRKAKRKETYWTRYREAELYKRGLSPWEIAALKYNRLTNPRVAEFLTDIDDEVEWLQKQFSLPSLHDAIVFRRENWEDLVLDGVIEEYDPYIRMGYWED